MQADAEHQQDDADLGQLAGQVLVADEARRERADGDAGQQVADQRRQAQLVRHEAADEGHDQPHGDGGDERGLVRHQRSLFGCRGGHAASVSITLWALTGLHHPNCRP